MKLGMIGTGPAAEIFVREAKETAGIAVRAVYDPQPDRAMRFIKESMGSMIGKADPSDDLDAFLSGIDAVYIAMPGKTHYDYIKTALSAGKHVLCETPMVLKRSEAEEVYGLADEKGLVLMEALLTAYCPGFFRVGNLLESGCIGEVRNIESCYTRLADPGSEELMDRETGGSFIRMGSFVLLPILHFLGTDWESITIDSLKADNGLDLFTRCSFTYKNAFATAKCGLGAKSEDSLTIAGDAGFMMAQAPWWKTGRVRFYDKNGGLAGIVEEAFEGDGLRYELKAFADAVEGTSDDSIPSAALTKEESIAMAGIMEQFLQERQPG